MDKAHLTKWKKQTYNTWFKQNCARKVLEGSAGSYIANFEQYGTTEWFWKGGVLFW